MVDDVKYLYDENRIVVMLNGDFEEFMYFMSSQKMSVSIIWRKLLTKCVDGVD